MYPSILAMARLRSTVAMTMSKKRAGATHRPPSRWYLLCALVLASVACTSPAKKPDQLPVEDINATTTRAEQSYANADWRTAAEAYGVLVAARSEDVDLWFRYANALARSEQPERAVTAYREVLRRDQHYAKAWFNMGIVQLRDAADSFAQMNAQVGSQDPLRVQSEQLQRDITAILDNNAGGKAATAGKPGPIVPSLGAPMPLDEGDLDLAPQR